MLYLCISSFVLCGNGSKIVVIFLIPSNNTFPKSSISAFAPKVFMSLTIFVVSPARYRAIAISATLPAILGSFACLYIPSIRYTFAIISEYFMAFSASSEAKAFVLIPVTSSYSSALLGNNPGVLITAPIRFLSLISVDFKFSRNVSPILTRDCV